MSRMYHFQGLEKNKTCHKPVELKILTLFHLSIQNKKTLHHQEK